MLLKSGRQSEAQFKIKQKTRDFNNFLYMKIFNVLIFRVNFSLDDNKFLYQAILHTFDHLTRYLSILHLYLDSSGDNCYRKWIQQFCPILYKTLDTLHFVPSLCNMLLIVRVKSKWRYQTVGVTKKQKNALKKWRKFEKWLSCNGTIPD